MKGPLPFGPLLLPPSFPPLFAPSRSDQVKTAARRGEAKPTPAQWTDGPTEGGREGWRGADICSFQPSPSSPCRVLISALAHRPKTSKALSGGASLPTSLPPCSLTHESNSVSPTMMMMMKVKLWALSGKLIAVKISLNNELYPTRLAWMASQNGQDEGGYGWRRGPDPEPRPDGFANCALNYASISMIHPFCMLHAERVQWLLQVRRGGGRPDQNK